MGRSFPKRDLWETGDHSGAEIWDALSTSSQRAKRRGPFLLELPSLAHLSKRN